MTHIERFLGFNPWQKARDLALLLLTICFLCWLLLLHPASAATLVPSASTTIDLTGLLTIALQTLAAIISALIIWALQRYGKKMGLDINEQQRLVLNQAVSDGIRFAQNTAESTIAPSAANIVVPNDVVATAAKYVLAQVPDAVAHFGATPDAIARKVVAWLPQDAAPPLAAK